MRISNLVCRWESRSLRPQVSDRLAPPRPENDILSPPVAAHLSGRPLRGVLLCPFISTGFPEAPPQPVLIGFGYRKTGCSPEPAPVLGLPSGVPRIFLRPAGGHHKEEHCPHGRAFIVSSFSNRRLHLDVRLTCGAPLPHRGRHPFAAAGACGQTGQEYRWN